MLAIWKISAIMKLTDVVSERRRNDSQSYESECQYDPVRSGKGT